MKHAAPGEKPTCSIIRLRWSWSCFHGSSYRRWCGLCVSAVLAAGLAGCSNPVGVTDASDPVTAIGAGLHDLDDVRDLMAHYAYQPDSSYGCRASSVCSGADS